MSRFQKFIDEGCKKKKKKKVDEGTIKLVFAGYHLKDNILDDITVEELQTMVSSNVPIEKIDVKTIYKEFDTLLFAKMRDARSVAKKVIPDLAKDFQNNREI